MRFVSYMRRSAKILILNKEGKISYERRAYELCPEKRRKKRAYLWLCPEKRRKKNSSI